MKEESYIAFEAYIQGELEGEALVDFENRLASDADFNRAYLDYSEVSQSLKSRSRHASGEKELRDTLNSIRNQQKSPKKGVLLKMNSYKWMAVAASLLLLFTVYVFSDSAKPTYTEYAMHEPLEMTVRGTTDTHTKAAETAFNKQDYSTAVAALGTLLSKDPGNVEWQLYYGIALLETDKIATASTVFDAIINGDSVYKYTAQWYTALGYLKTDKIEWCKSALKLIPKEAAEYEKAQDLLERL